MIIFLVLILFFGSLAFPIWILFSVLDMEEGSHQALVTKKPKAMPQVSVIPVSKPYKPYQWMKTK
jgi:hypothetical protein